MEKDLAQEIGTVRIKLMQLLDVACILRDSVVTAPVEFDSGQIANVFGLFADEIEAADKTLEAIYDNTIRLMRKPEGEKNK